MPGSGSVVQRFYDAVHAAAMKSINNLLLLGDGETWSRQAIDFGGLPEMVRCFLQVAAGAADIPVTRLLGQSPSGLSATGESDTRNDARHDRGAAGGGTHADPSAWDPTSTCARSWSGWIA